MSNFERIQYYYSRGWAKKEQVVQYVVFGVISSLEYESITGQPYQGQWDL